MRVLLSLALALGAGQPGVRVVLGLDTAKRHERMCVALARIRRHGRSGDGRAGDAANPARALARALARRRSERGHNARGNLITLTAASGGKGGARRRRRGNRGATRARRAPCCT